MDKKTIISLLAILIMALIPLAACAPATTITPLVDKAGTAVAATMTTIAQSTSIPVVSEAAPTTTGQETPTLPSTSVIRESLVAGDGTLWVWTDGTPAAIQISGVTQAERSMVSPDGSLIAFTKKFSEESYELDVINADGSNLQTLISSDQFASMSKLTNAIAAIPNQITWIPGTHSLALNTRALFMGPGSAVNPDLIIIDADTGVFNKLLSVDETWQFYYSPDGSRIIITLPDGINLYNSSGNRITPEKFITYSQVNTASEYQWTAKPVWKTDGSAFAFIVPPAEPWTENPEDSKVILVAGDGASASTVFTSQILFMPNPVISPDLSQIAYLTKPDATQNIFDFRLASLVGGENIVYSPNSYVSKIAWSPDSKHFLYSVNANGVNQTFLGAPESQPRSITEVTSLSSMKWIDANRYLILDMSGNGWKLWLGNINSAPVVLYSDALSNDQQAQLDVSP